MKITPQDATYFMRLCLGDYTYSIDSDGNEVGVPYSPAIEAFVECQISSRWDTTLFADFCRQVADRLEETLSENKHE